MPRVRRRVLRGRRLQGVRLRLVQTRGGVGGAGVRRTGPGTDVAGEKVAEEKGFESKTARVNRGRQRRRETAGAGVRAERGRRRTEEERSQRRPKRLDSSGQEWCDGKSDGNVKDQKTGEIDDAKPQQLTTVISY